MMMKSILALLALCHIGLLAFAKDRKPNVIFVLADDLGWAELGCYGNTFHETPHLDKLAKQGIRFTPAYAAAPVCSPYRAALLTGQYPARVGILDYLRPNSSNALPVSHVTLPKILRRNGYATGMAGKWHLTGYKYQKAKSGRLPTALTGIPEARSRASATERISGLMSFAPSLSAGSTSPRTASATRSTLLTA